MLETVNDMLKTQISYDNSSHESLGFTTWTHAVAQNETSYNSLLVIMGPKHEHSSENL